MGKDVAEGDGFEQDQGLAEAKNTSSEAGAAAPDLKAELEDYKDKYLRALAETDNVRKRALKEKSDLLKYQGEQIFRDILDITDDLDRALEHKESPVEQLRQGLEMIQKKLVTVLGKWEVRSEVAIGKDFDPTRHEALSRVPAADAKPGTVINEFRRAYMYKDKLLRTAQVVVADAGTSEAS